LKLVFAVITLILATTAGGVKGRWRTPRAGDIIVPRFPTGK
jgi:hypothetical protein